MFFFYCKVIKETRFLNEKKIIIKKLYFQSLLIELTTFKFFTTNY